MTTKKWNGTTIEIKKSAYMATIYNGYSHIERVVYEDSVGFRYVKINGFLFNVDSELNHFDVNVWYRG